VTGVGPGSATITVTTVDGGFKAQIPVTVQPLPPKLFKVSVQVSGLDGSKVVLLNNATDKLEVTANGSFAFTNKASNYSVTVQDHPQGFQYCKVSNGSGVATADVTATVTCAPGKAQISTLAGSGSQGLVDGVGTSASFYEPKGLDVDAAENVYVADGFAIRKITRQGVVSTIAGSLESAFPPIDGVGPAAKFFYPSTVAFDAKTGYLYVGESRTVRKVTAAGVVTTLYPVDRYYVTAVTVDASGNLYMAPAGRFYIMKRPPTGGQESTFGQADLATTVKSMALDRKTGIFYVTDQSAIHKVTPTGGFSTFVGVLAGAYADGTGIDARFNKPGGLAVDATGNIFVADTGNNKIRKITPAGVVTTVCDVGIPFGIAVDSSDTLYVSSQATRSIIKITPGP
jgi:sugar lactone lactonase YvrE